MDHRKAILIGLAAFCFAAKSAGAQAQSSSELPFAPGEELVYKARVGSLGTGTAVTKVLGPYDLRGEQTWLTQFDYRGKLLLLTIENHTKSWLSLASLGAVRYEKSEKIPLSSTHREYDFDAAANRWTEMKGDTGQMITKVPLDELSVMYFVRGLTLPDSSVQTFQRHFMAARNPIQVRVLRREKVEVPLGAFQSVVVEVRTPAADSTRKDDIVLIHLSDDKRRLPLRVEKSVKVAGTMVLTLKCISPAAEPGPLPSAACR